MKFALRRSTEPARSASDAPPPGDQQPPRGTVGAAFAGILDGRSLWLAVAAQPGHLALRDAGGGLHPLLSDLPAGDPDHLSVRADLTEVLAALPAADDAVYDVVVAAPGGAARPIWSPPLAAGPVRVPPATDGGTQLALARSDDGTLQVRRTEAPRGAFLDRVEVEDGTVVLHLDTDRGDLLLLAEDEAAGPLLRLPLETTDRGGRVRLSADDLPTDAPGPTRAVVEAPAGRLPVRRRRNDLADPGRAALLPQVATPDGQVVARLRWNPGGALVVRLVGPDAEAGA